MGIESMRIDAILMNVGKTDYSIQTCFSLSYNFIYHDLINAHVDFLQELLSYTQTKKTYTNVGYILDLRCT